MQRERLADLSLAITYPKPSSIIGGAVAVSGFGKHRSVRFLQLECSSAAPTLAADS